MRQIRSGLDKKGALFCLLLTLVFVAGSLVLNFLNNDFAKKQLTDYSKSNPAITSASLAWPRLISEPNDLASFNSRLSNWDVKANFLIFRQMRDAQGVKYILIADKNYKDYFKGSASSEPNRCDQSICQVIAASKDGVGDIKALIPGVEIIDQVRLAEDVPLPEDFGFDKDVSLLITPMLDELSNWQPLRYLPATYGWQITPSNSALTADEYRLELERLGSKLNAEFANVAVNYQAENLNKLIGFQEKITSLSLHYILTAFFIYLLALAIIWRRFKLKGVRTYLLIAISVLIIQGVWGFATLLQLLIYALLFGAALFVINHLLDSYLIKRNFQSLALFRSSLITLLSITILIGISTSILFSASQYLMRTEAIRIDLVDKQTPLDYTLKIDRSLSRPLDLGSLSEIKALSNGGRVVPIIRGSASLLDENGDEVAVNLIAQGGDLFNEQVLPIGLGRQVVISTSGIADQIDLIIWLKNQSGAHYSITTTGKGSRVGVIPSERVGENFIVGFGLSLNPDYATTREHALAEATGRSFEILNGRGSILSVAVDARVVPVEASWPIKSFTYALSDSPFILRPAITDLKVNLLVSDEIKAEISQLKLAEDLIIEVDQIKQGAFIGAEKPYVVLDLESYQKLLATTAPYSLDPLEIWVEDGGDNFAQSFADSKFNSLKLVSRDKLLTGQQNSPYWISWQKILVSTLLLLSLLLLITIFYLLSLFNQDRRGKDWEFKNYFNTSPIAIKPILALLTAGIPLGIFLLLLSRVIASLLT